MHKISVCFCTVQVLRVNAQDFCLLYFFFFYYVQVLMHRFFVLQHAFSLQWTINIYFYSFMSWALCFLFFYVVFSDCSVVFLILIDSGHDLTTEFSFDHRLNCFEVRVWFWSQIKLFWGESLVLQEESEVLWM